MVMCEKYSISVTELMQIARGVEPRSDFFKVQSTNSSKKASRDESNTFTNDDDKDRPEIRGSAAHLGGLPTFLGADGMGSFGIDDVRFRRGVEHVEDGSGEDISNQADGKKTDG